MDKMILEHVNIQDIPSKWSKLLKNLVSTSYKITIEAESKADKFKNSKNKKSWKNAPMFGMWKDRDDMSEPVDYLNKIRKPRF